MIERRQFTSVADITYVMRTELRAALCRDAKHADLVQAVLSMRELLQELSKQEGDRIESVSDTK